MADPCRAPRHTVFAVLTGAIHHRDRAEFVRSTWCAELDSCVFVSDERDPALHNVVITLENLPASIDGYQRAQLRCPPHPPNLHSPPPPLY